MEVFVMCRIAYSPLLAGLVLSGVAYLALPRPYGLIVGSIITLAALIIGIRMARSFMKMQNEMNPDTRENTSAKR